MENQRVGEPRREPVLHEKRAPVTPHLLFGVLIIAVGILFTLDNFGFADAKRYWRWWPAGLIAIGLAKLWHARRAGGTPVGGLFFLLIGTWFLLDNMGVVDRDLWAFWPLLLVFIGSMIVYQGIQGRQSRASADANDTVSGVAILGGWKRSSASSAFRGGELTAVMGGCEVDLRSAAVNGDAVFDVFAVWGGIEIRVPENWTVINRVTPVLGGVEDNTRPPQSPTGHRLTIRGLVIMGGIDIKN